MGIDRIRYKPWKGERTSKIDRMLEISKKIAHDKIRSKGVLAVLIIGAVVVHFFSLVTLMIFPHEKLTAEMMLGGGMFGAYLSSDIFTIMTFLLAAVVTSDLISQDLHDNSFVMYFSRPIRPMDYLFGKTLGAAMIMGIFCLLPPVLGGTLSIATQSGNDYAASIEILASTFLGASFLTVLFIPLSMLLSTITERRSYAGIGSFMFFFVLIILGDLFSGFDEKWRLISPTHIVKFSMEVMFGKGLPSSIDAAPLVAVILALTVAPLLVSLYLLNRKAVGK